MTTTPATFSSEEWERLDQVQKLLTGITAPRVAPVAASLGYDDAEHARGWELWELASGHKRPFSHALAVIGVDPGPGPTAAWTELDRFENKWFPRTRNAIRRFVPPPQRDQVLGAFFLNLQQQPDGPLVVGSVSLFLERLDGLRTSDAPGAAEAWESLVKKGLSDDELGRIRELLAQTRKAPQAAAPSPLGGALEADAKTQREAWDAVNLWYIDWADALRDELGYHDRLRLGVSEGKGGPKPKTPVSENTTD